jgi:hypothetical protein
MMNELEP